MHVASHIYDRCITGQILKGRTVILVTHHLSLCLTKANYLVELANGHVIRQGAVEDLRTAGELKEIQAEMPAQTEEVGATEETLLINEADQVSGTTTPYKSRSKSKGKLVTAEVRAEGRIKLSTYKTYLKAGGWSLWIITLALLLSLRGVAILNQVLKQ